MRGLAVICRRDDPKTKALAYHPTHKLSFFRIFDLVEHHLKISYRKGDELDPVHRAKGREPANFMELGICGSLVLGTADDDDYRVAEDATLGDVH